NGISVPGLAADDTTSVRSAFGVPADAKLVVQIGRLARSKRNELLLESVTRLPAIPKVHVLLVGEGEQAQYLDELVGRMRLQGRVHFCGYRSDIAHILDAADLLALTSDKKGLPIVILEAMAMRCPIVATRVGEIPRVLRDGEDAWLVPSGD